MSTSRRPGSSAPLAGGRRTALVVLAAAAAWLGLGAASREAFGEQPAFKVIVHPDNPSRRADRQFLANAFLKNVSQWSDGRVIQPVDQHRDSAVRRRFSERVIRRSVAAVRSYWQQKIFSGRGVPPPELDSDQAVVRYVLGHRGGVGYVSAAADVGGARVLEID